MFASFGDTMYSLLISLKAFGETMYTMMFTPLSETIEMLEQSFPLFDFDGAMVTLLLVLGEEATAEILSSSLLTLTLSSFIVVYVLFTIVKYVVNLVT